MSTPVNTPNEIQYIKEEYIRMGLLREDGTKTVGDNDIDYIIYPWEKGYIPKCIICNTNYTHNKLGLNYHNIRHEGCLWFNWFKRKTEQNKKQGK